MKQQVKSYLKSLVVPNSIIIEVGAHYGEDTVGFLRSLNPSRIHCFEPDPRNIFIFKKYVKDPNIFLYECAVSDKDEKQVDFHLSYIANFKPRLFDKYHWIDKKEYVNMKLNASGSSSFEKGRDMQVLNTVKIDTIRIDTWAEKNKIKHVDFMWIDVQGAEKKVVEGFGKLSINCVWIEFGENTYKSYLGRQETIDLFSTIGFEVDEKYSDKDSKGDLLFWKRK